MQCKHVDPDTDKRCGAQALRGDHLCYFHSPATRDDAQAARSKGALAKQKGPSTCSRAHRARRVRTIKKLAAALEKSSRREYLSLLIDAYLHKNLSIEEAKWLTTLSPDSGSHATTLVLDQWGNVIEKIVDGHPVPPAQGTPPADDQEDPPADRPPQENGKE